MISTGTMQITRFDPPEAPRAPPAPRPTRPFNPGFGSATIITRSPPPASRLIGEVYGRIVGYDAWTVAGGGTGGPPLTFGIGLTKAGNNVDLDAATLAEIGGLLEAPSDGTPYVRQDAAWVAAAAAPPATPYDFRIGLDETAPGVVDLLAATDAVIGGLVEPPPDGLLYLRSNTAGVGTWQPAAAGTAYIWGIGLDETTPGTIDLLPATPTELGGITEPPADDLNYVRMTASASGLSEWVQTTAGGYTWGIGLDEVPGGSGNIDLLPATDIELGGVTVQARTDLQGLALDALGDLSAPLATDLLAGTIVEPPPDDLTYARTRSSLTGVSAWVQTQAGAFVGDDPPPAPNYQGQFWFESDSGKLWVYYDDGTSAQWVKAGGP
jgi:hypothetical protein